MRETSKPRFHHETRRFRPFIFNSLQDIPVYLSLSQTVFFVLFKIHSFICSLSGTVPVTHSSFSLHKQLANSMNYKQGVHLCVLPNTILHSLRLRNLSKGYLNVLFYNFFPSLITFLGCIIRTHRFVQ